MINVKKGPAHSLGQADVRGTATTGITAGMLCYIDKATGVTTICPAASTTGLGLRGFALNNSDDGDVVESNKIALYTLDGASVIETDQVDVANDSGATGVNLASYPIGTPMYQSGSVAGKVGKTANGSTGIIGWVEGIRYLQRSGHDNAAASASTQSYTSATEGAAWTAAGSGGLPTYSASTLTGSFKPQTNVAMLSIKLASLAYLEGNN